MSEHGWKTKDGFCTLCGYEMLAEEREEWAWCFTCGNGSPAYESLKEALDRSKDQVVPVLVRKRLRVITRTGVATVVGPLGRSCGCRDLAADPNADWDSSQPRCSCEGSCMCHSEDGDR